MYRLTRLIIILIAFLAIVLFIVFVIPSDGAKRRSIYSTANPSPFISDIAEKFRTQAWRHEEEQRREEEKQRREADKAAAAARNTQQRQPQTVVVSDVEAGKILDRNIEAIRVSGLDAGQRVVNILAQSVFISPEIFTTMYDAARRSSSFDNYYNIFRDTSYAGLAVEIYLRLHTIDYLIRTYEY